MSAVAGDSNRNVIPRLRPFGIAARSGELTSVHAKGPDSSVTAGDIRAALSAFSHEPGIFTATDVLAQAVVRDAGTDRVESVAKYVIGIPDAPEPARALADWALGDRPRDYEPTEDQPVFDLSRARRRVARVRSILSVEPRNAIRWVELALIHLNLGSVAAAVREMRVATSLAPTNRYVLRSAARLLVQIGDPDQARALVSDQDLLVNDPWLLATEIAVSEVAGKRSSNLRRARQIVERSEFGPWHLSELASQVATSELRHGSIRRAKKLMRTALIKPNDNALAQAEWASQHGLDRPDDSALSHPLSFEARARWHAQEGEFSQALAEGRRWQADQPFAPDAAVLTSYVASVGVEDYEAAIAVARQGLIANPGDVMIRNNLVFSLASAGRLGDAVEELARMPHHEDTTNDAVLQATRGLVAFRSGDITSGRENYQGAVRAFKARRQPEEEHLATMFWAREEVLARTGMAGEVFRKAESNAQGSALPEVKLWLIRVADMFGASLS